MNETNIRILVVIPAYNEADRIGSVVSSIKASPLDCDILVVDDCSNDDTRKVAIGAGAKVITHALNLGYGSGLESGYRYAFENGYDAVAQMDGDGQHLAEELPKIIKPIKNGEADIVIGSRYMGEPGGYRIPLLKKIGHTFFSAIYLLLTGERITDPTSGFQCLNKKAIALDLSGQFPDDFPDTDVLLLAHYAGLRIKETPVRMAERDGGESIHDGFRPLIYVVKMLLSIFIVLLSSGKLRRHGT